MFPRSAHSSSCLVAIACRAAGTACSQEPENEQVRAFMVSTSNAQRPLARCMILCIFALHRMCGAKAVHRQVVESSFLHVVLSNGSPRRLSRMGMWTASKFTHELPWMYFATYVIGTIVDLIKVSHVTCAPCDRYVPNLALGPYPRCCVTSKH
jgi:hypothetical protein